MKEFGLQRIWEKLAFQPQYLATDNGQPLQIINQGEWNNQNGPDFLNAEVVINGIHCFGAIEIHIKASDWYFHQHHTDPRYNGVILHVVWQNDRGIDRNISLFSTMALVSRKAMTPSLAYRLNQGCQNLT